MSPSIRRWAAVSLGALALGGATALSSELVRGQLSFMWGKLRGGYTLAQRLEQFGPAVSSRVRVDFERAGLAYPAHELAYLAFKDTRILEVYARMSPKTPWRFVKQYPVLAASGKPGPKLRQGDNQVPEGLYRAATLNPNSRFHLSIGLNYPNEFDQRMAQTEGRTELGGDIMIHGSAVSIGCLAVGDQAAEDLFILAALTSKERVKVLISPTDFRHNAQTPSIQGRVWVGQLYADIGTELAQFSREAGRAGSGI